MALKFEFRKVDALTGLVEAIWECAEKSEVNDVLFKVVATQRGVELKGYSPVLDSMDDLEAFAKTVSDAWTMHRKLQPKLIRPGGHNA